MLYRPRFRRCTPRAKGLRGASLVEVLVALLILSVGLLGLAGMQLRALRGSVSSVQRTQATLLAQYILDVMRVDRLAALNGHYDLQDAATGGVQCAVPPAGTATLAERELNDWFTQVKSQLGRTTDTSTCVHIGCDTQGVCTVQLRWDDSAAGGLSDQTVSITTRL